MSLSNYIGWRLVLIYASSYISDLIDTVLPTRFGFFKCLWISRFSEMSSLLLFVTI